MMLLPTEEEIRLENELDKAKTETEKKEIRKKLDEINEERLRPFQEMGFAV